MVGYSTGAKFVLGCEKGAERYHGSVQEWFVHYIPHKTEENNELCGLHDFEPSGFRECVAVLFVLGIAVFSFPLIHSRFRSK